MTSFLDASKRTALTLVVAAVVTIGLVFAGDLAFDRGWGIAPWIAWPGGASVFLIPGAVIWALLMIPSGRMTGIWTRRFATITISATVMGAVMQLLDDHVMNHPGTNNPLGFSLPMQDYLELLPLLLVVVSLIGALVTIPGRIRH